MYEKRKERKSGNAKSVPNAGNRKKYKILTIETPFQFLQTQSIAEEASYNKNEFQIYWNCIKYNVFEVLSQPTSSPILDEK